MPDLGLDYRDAMKLPTFQMEVALGRVNGVSYVLKYFENADIDTTREDVNYGGDLTYLAAAAPIFISSSNNSDTQTMRVQGIDGDYKLIQEDIVMAGQAKTALTKQFLRIHRAYNISSTSFAGTVYLYADDTVTAGVPQTASKIQVTIPSSSQQTLTSAYTIPAGYAGLLSQWHIGVGRSITTTGTIWLQIREPGGVFRVRDSFECLNTAETLNRTYCVPLYIPAKSDVKFSCETSANNVDVYGNYCLYLFDLKTAMP